MVKKINKMKLLRVVGIALYDILILAFAEMAALLLRYDFDMGNIPSEFFGNLFKFLPILIVITVAVFAFMHLYQNLWQFASIYEYALIFYAAAISYTLSTVLRIVVGLVLPRSCYAMSAVIFCLGTVCGRVLYRVIRNRYRSGLPMINKKDANMRRVMLIGAGEAANILLREFNASDLHNTRRVVCIIDDDKQKHNSRMYGINIVGGRDKIMWAAEKYEVNEIIYAIPSAPAEEKAEILNICKTLNCPMKTLPGLSQLVNNEISSDSLVNVDVNDLLGRDPVTTDVDAIIGYIKEKTVVVTGGGGSIGSELCRQIASHSPRKLIIIDIYENNAYDIQMELLRTCPDVEIIVLIASVRDAERIDTIFKEYKPDIVFHAAAHKHVPLMETSPEEAVKNNVFGTFNTVRAADKNGVSRFVMISTDKAVNPTNVMGATKRICEMIIQTYDKISKTEFVAVRFGNVLGSNGSVIPLFKKQIAEGGPVTVTHPGIIRFFMTIPEAVSLVLRAGAFAEGGEIFILDMGKPVKILDLAENLIRLSGRTPYVDINIEFTGLRPGEKLYEEILMDEEGLKETEDKMIYIGKPVVFDTEEFFEKLRVLQDTLQSKGDIRQAIQSIVPIKNSEEV